MLALANIRKKKGVAISMGLLILLATAMFHVGLTLLCGIGSFYDDANERLGGPHYIVRFGGNQYSEEYLDYFQQDDRVETVQSEEIALMNVAVLPGGGTLSVNFRRIMPEAAIQSYTLKKLAEVPDAEAVYVPKFMKDMGCEPGGELTLKFNQQMYTFRVAGYSESTWLHSSASTLVDIFMPDEAFESLYARIGGGSLLSVRLKDSGGTEQLRRDFQKETDVEIGAVSLDVDVMDLSLAEMRSGSTMVVTILSVVLFAFSFLMVAVAVIVMRFRIINHIEIQMADIGAMQAIGYTGRQIQASIVMEFIVIGLGASVLGICGAGAIIAGLSHLITSTVGVRYVSGGQAGYALISIGSVLLIVFLVSWRTAARAARLLPVTALRGGRQAHSFRKNYFPLSRVKMGLVAALGCKQVAFQKKTYVAMAVIFAGVSFACAFGLIIWQNMGADNEMVTDLTGFEICDILAYAAPHTDYEALCEKLLSTEEVRKVGLYEAESIRVGEELLTCYVSDDFASLETISVYEGDFPRYDNEIVPTGVLAESWGKSVGDTVEVSVDGIKADYVICGLTQTMNNFGRQCFLTDEGYRRLVPAYEPQSIQVYLAPGHEDVGTAIQSLEKQFFVVSPNRLEEEIPSGADTAEAAKEAAKRKAEEKLTALLSMYGAKSAQYALLADGEVILSGGTQHYEIDHFQNNLEMFNTSINSIASAATLMSLLILCGTFAMLALVFHMVIKSLLLKQKNELGIYKALGYRDRQLMNMVAVSFLPPAVAGVAAGSILACLLVNPLSSRLFWSVGVSKMEFAISPWLIGGMGVGLLLFTWLLCLMEAGKIKGITVYGLLKEE